MTYDARRTVHGARLAIPPQALPAELCGSATTVHGVAGASAFLDITTGRRPDPRQSGRVDPIPGWGNHGGPLHGLAGAPTVENFIEIASTESEVSGVGRYMYGTSGVHRSRYPWFGPVWTRVDFVVKRWNRPREWTQ